MSDRSAILVYGTAGCLKSTISRLLVKRLPATHVAPFHFGEGHDKAGVADQELRRTRYRRFITVLEERLIVDATLLLEGCFDFEWVQKRVTALLQGSGRQVTLVRCWTSNPAETLNRLRRRTPDPARGVEAVDPGTALAITLEIPGVLRDLKWASGAHISFDSITGEVVEDWVGTSYRDRAYQTIRGVLSEVV